MPATQEKQTQETVTATARTGKFNKNAARRVRVAGKIPGVVYGAQQPSVAVELDPKQMLRILQSPSGHNTIFDLQLADGPSAKAMIVDWQYEPIKDSLLHVDLKRIAMDKTMRVAVPILLEGTATGVKNEGGILDQVLREVEIECLPGDIPSHLGVDVSNLGLHDVLRVSDLPHAGKIKFLTEENATVAHVTAVKEEAAAAEVSAAAPGSPEPEVVKKGKQESAEGKSSEGGKK